MLISADTGLPFDGPRNASSMRVERTRLWLFKVPHGGLVAGLTLDFSGPLSDSIPLLEDAYYGEVETESGSLLDTLRFAAGDLGPYLEATELGTHGHQLLFVPASCEDLVDGDDHSRRQVNHDLVRRLIYRYDAPYRQDSGLVVFPPETNRRMRALAACGPYFSVLASQQDYVENCALVAAVQLVGCADLLGTTRAEAFEALTSLRTLQAEVDDSDRVEHRQVRRQLARLSERVGRLELDLSFGVEAYQEIAALVPSLRVSDLHRQLLTRRRSRSRAAASTRSCSAWSARSRPSQRPCSPPSRGRRKTAARRAWRSASPRSSHTAHAYLRLLRLATTDVSRDSSLLDFERYKWSTPW